MAEIRPFKAVLFNPGRVNMADVVAPPYDVVSEDQRERLYNKTPYNILHVDYGREMPGDSEYSNKYTRARDLLKSWLTSGILITAEKPAFYAYQIDYQVHGKNKTLTGFMALVKIEEFGKGNIHPHEATHSKPKTDRLNLMKTCNGNISPIYALYKSPERRSSKILYDLRRQKPFFQFVDEEGIKHSLWIIYSERDIEIIRKELSDKAIFIADGHHRYETALQFKKEISSLNPHDDGTEPYDYVLMFLANMADDGITILPTHRAIRDLPSGWHEMLKEYFEISRVRLKKPSDIVKKILGKEHTLGLYTQNQTFILRYLGKDLSDLHPALRYLDVSILHNLIFDKLLGISEILYEMNPEEVVKLVDSGQYRAGFFLNATKVEEVEIVALSSLRMPPKSTYFYPKLKTGTVINLFEYSFDKGVSL
ncbi:MAG: DUF1015 domain-containing protein [Thermodesulfovibrionales bacterium]|nr:DUF1015 domain-containing protein [Thermodesulfovibrionales bacterium]